MNTPVTIFKASAFRAGCKAVEVNIEQRGIHVSHVVQSPYSLVEIRAERKDIMGPSEDSQCMVWEKWYYSLQAPNDTLSSLPCRCDIVIQGEQHKYHFKAIYNGCDAFTLLAYCPTTDEKIMLHPRHCPIPPHVLEDIDGGFGIYEGETQEAE